MLVPEKFAVPPQLAPVPLLATMLLRTVTVPTPALIPPTVPPVPAVPAVFDPDPVPMLMLASTCVTPSASAAKCVRAWMLSACATPARANATNSALIGTFCHLPAHTTERGATSCADTRHTRGTCRA